MRLLAGLAELVAPTRCAGCDMPGQLLCEPCRALALRFDAAQSCPRCAAPFGALVCTECWERSFAFEAALAIGDLSPPLHRSVVLYKDAHERRLGPVLGAILGQRARERWPDWVGAVAWVPPTASALARRGYDHAGEIASAVTRELGAPPLDVLRRTEARDQRLLGRVARAENAAGVFTATGPIRGRVLLVDDVMTTGATADAATCALMEAGAAAVRVAIVARAW